ncbi:MAG: hypothetical protein MJ229_02650 [bacterium]|nr:hypothetical protein [bacterium]
MKKIFLSVLVLVIYSALPSFAKLDGKITQSYIYDKTNTLMVEDKFIPAIKTEEYWNNNELRANKYQPLFLLSNKELINLIPKEPVSIVDRIVTPDVYNISLKKSSIINVSFAEKNSTTKKVDLRPQVQKTQAKSTPNYNELYKQAKSSDTDTDIKIDIAKKLKDTHNIQNCIMALDILNDVTKSEPYNAYAFYLKGELFIFKKDANNAMKCYLEALKINPTSKQCYLGIAKILEPSNKTLAQKYYDKAK